MGRNLDRPIQGAMFSYQYSLIRNLNHSIWMSDGQVMSKIQSYGRRKKTGQHLPLIHLCPSTEINPSRRKTLPQMT